MSEIDVGENGGKKKKTKHVAHGPKLKERIYIRDLSWTPKQLKLIELLQRKDVKCVFISGPAGTSKTIVSVYAALHMLNNLHVNEIVYIRAAVESADSHLGFLPGDIDDKIGPYTVPFMEKLNELLDKGTTNRLKSEGFFKTCAINFLRGMHMADKAVIVDEAQCATIKDLITIITRMGEGSKLVICGDPMQSDLPHHKSGGMQTLSAAFNTPEANENGIYHFEFDSSDIIRSEFVKFIVSVLEQKNIKY